MRFHALIASAMLVFTASCHAQQPETINLGDHKLAIVRAGKGGPTVVFESGGGQYSGIETGQKVRAQVSKFAATVAYARAGRSPSTQPSSPRTVTAVVDDLHILLDRTGIRPPYILVGGSLGGLYVRAFALLHPKEVAGLVLVDGTHERQWLEWDRLQGLPPGKTVGTAIADFRAKKDETSTREMEGLADVWSSGTLGISGSLPDVPMVVITGMRPDRLPEMLRSLRSLHDEWFAATTHGMRVVTSKSGHNIFGEEPALVVEAIRWVVEAARSDLIDKKAP